MTTSGSDVPTVPVRMLNCFLYCPRLFHLEWVQGEWADNADTVDGSSVHARVDRPSRQAASADAIADGDVARSVDLDAPAIGLVAKLDMVEATDGFVSPIERKRGRPRDDGQVWEPEELQVVAQAMILRENGYRVRDGILSYPQARRRVTIEITDDRVARVHEAVRRLRQTAVGPTPPPLVDSPKCPRCSLVSICLPDETALLAADDEVEPARPRLLLTPRDDALPVYVQQPGARLGIKSGRLEVRYDDEILASVRLIDVSSLGLFGNVTLSAQALRAVLNQGAVVTHHTSGGWLVGITTGPGHRNALVRIRQFATASDEGASLAIARCMIVGKVKNQRTMLRRNHASLDADALPDLARHARASQRAQSLEALLGYEGSAARAYFQRFSGMLKGAGAAFDFTTRNRRPPRDPVNAALSFCYAMLTRETVIAVVRVGLDPYVGVLHQPRYGRPALALDLAEEFRPIIADSVVIGAMNTGEISAEHFVERAGACALTFAGRRALLTAFERRMTTEIRHPTFGYTVTYRRALELQARFLARCFTGEALGYRPFRTR